MVTGKRGLLVLTRAVPRDEMRKKGAFVRNTLRWCLSRESSFVLPCSHRVSHVIMDTCRGVASHHVKVCVVKANVSTFNLALKSRPGRAHDGVDGLLFSAELTMTRRRSVLTDIAWQGLSARGQGNGDERLWRCRPSSSYATSDLGAGPWDGTRDPVVLGLQGQRRCPKNHHHARVCQTRWMSPCSTG